jgi:F-type H+-transporting ATPase subunit gamma
MANLKEIRRRIHSVQNTQKITRAMKMVSAAKLRRAQDRVTRFRAYADLTQGILAEVAGGATSKDHPLLAKREVARCMVLTISSDRGLCGAFNGNLNRAVQKHVEEAEVKPSLAIVGKKARDYFSRRQVEIHTHYEDVYTTPEAESAKRIAFELSDLFASGAVDRIDLAFNEFVSVIKQQPTFKPLLPIELEAGEEEKQTDELGPAGFKYEPDRHTILAELLPKYVEVQVYRAIVESVAAEHAARMTAMDAATNNAGDMIDHLTLQYNRARQSAITKELMDIVGGAEALGE